MAIITKKSVLKKMLAYRKNMQQGRYALQLVELNYSNQCNFKCQHCFSKNLSPSHARMPMEAVRELADQADALGAWQWHLQGGEPTIWPELAQVVEAIDPSRFHLFITSNGSMLTRDKARMLADIGIDKVSVSIDSFDAGAHDAFRRHDGAFDKAMAALFHVRDMGMEANINTCVTALNAQSEGLMELVRFAEEHNFTMLFVIAAPVGAWAGRHDLLISEEDAQHLLDLKRRYPFVHRDLYPVLGVEWGCRTVNGLIYVTPDGDVLSCPFIHIVLGNIHQEPLADILKRGWRVRYFRDYSPKCLVGEDRDFIEKIIPKYAWAKGAVPFEAAFTDDDLYPE